MFCTIADLTLYKNTKKRLMGIDLGDKTIGLSLSDLSLTIATPYKTLSRQGQEKSFNELKGIIEEHKVAALVFGYPLNMNGSEGTQSQKVKAFASKFYEFYPIPIFLWDERLSTAAVTRTMITADLSRKRQKEVVDKMAASFILQGVLDTLKRME
ncbi:MAG: Holliday junction resolvase RuvX [Alphaproteobacteria bacterium]|nr:Holliday junction resolvase RuvX [Alphaproteobacteria bacterium]